MGSGGGGQSCGRPGVSDDQGRASPAKQKMLCGGVGGCVTDGSESCNMCLVRLSSFLVTSDLVELIFTLFSYLDCMQENLQFSVDWFGSEENRQLNSVVLSKLAY
jgi:hypothetical protein